MIQEGNHFDQSRTEDWGAYQSMAYHLNGFLGFWRIDGGCYEDCSRVFEVTLARTVKSFKEWASFKLMQILYRQLYRGRE